MIALIFSIQLPAHADEGMWLPLLLKDLNEKDMKKMGMKMTAEDIYSVNKSSMKDAVVLFGKGCTGEIVSNEGLLITNHHCGFGQIQDHSALDHDYLKNGFWAMDRSQELSNPGLTATFIIRIEDVTSQITNGMENVKDEAEREAMVGKRAIEIIKNATAGSHYEGSVKAMYSGNEYYLFVTEVFKDVRLVGAPPMTMGNFGKDSDNWTWPRHTADFSMFRIYAGKDNKPAEYSQENVPFNPRYHFPVSLAGVSEKDFTMVYGFPGKTNEYQSSFAVDQLLEVNNPLKIALRGKKLDVYNKYMNADREVFIKYADKYSGVSNYHKKWAGEMKGLKKANAYEKKIEYEKLFQSRVEASTQFSAYKSVLPELKNEYEKLAAVQPEYELFSEGLLTIELLKQAISFRPLAELIPSEIGKEKGIDVLKKLRTSSETFFKDYYAPIDREIMTEMITAFFKRDVNTIPEEYRQFYQNGFVKEDISVAVNTIFDTSFLDDEAAVKELLTNPDSAGISRLQDDPAYQLAVFYYDYFRSTILKEFTAINNRLIPLNRLYMKAQREVIPERKYYPDANLTLRVAFGKVEGYSPADAVDYEWFTTAEGILQKSATGVSDYTIEPRLREMIQQKEFGIYADKSGNLRTCFAASNHTTGGNSGSPVINANGQLIGINFDRNWEGTMSDVYYDINQVRNIVLDVRYCLWIIDKYAGAGHLVKEMTVVK